MLLILLHYAVIKVENPSVCDIAMLSVKIKTKTVLFHMKKDPFNKTQSNAHMH